MKISNKSIGTQLFGISSLIFFLIGIILILIVNQSMKKHALHEAEEKSLIILNRNLATHTYYTHRLKPLLFELTEQNVGSDYFEPVWMSSTYAVRETNKYFHSLSKKDYYYKECAINARSPENEADDIEKAFIRRLNKDPRLNVTSGTKKTNGTNMLYVMRRGEKMEAICLRCHDTPERAPKGLIDLYGPEKSFNREIGETISAISLQIPLSVAYAEANKMSLILSIIFISSLGLIWLIQLKLGQRFIISPINKIRSKALKISQSNKYLGEQIETQPGLEFADLTQAFNQMSVNLKYQYDQLLIVNEDLKKEVDARKKIAEHLELKQEQMTQFINSSTDGFIMFDADFNHIEINDMALKITGLTRDQVIGRHISDTVPDIKKTIRYHQYKGVLRTGKPIIIPDITNHPLTGKRHIELKAFKVGDGLGIIFTDITEQKRLELALGKREKKYRLLAEKSRDIVFRTNIITQEYEYISPSIKSVTGYSVEAFYKNPLLLQEMLPDGWDAYFQAKWQEIEEGHTPSGYEFPIVHKKTGELRWLSQSNDWIRAEGGTLVALQGRVSDITDRKKAEDRVAESKKNLEKMVQKRTSKLVEMNTALKVLLQKREDDRLEIEEKIFQNYKLLAIPLIQQLKDTPQKQRNENLTNILESTLNDILSPFSKKLSDPLVNLTPKEIRIADLIKNGQTNKEIAEILIVSVHTIATHRENIRKKLGLKNKKINLRSFLSSID